MATRDPSYRGKGKGNGSSRGSVYKSKRPIGGYGIFVTCVRGKESRAVIEIMDLLDEVSFLKSLFSCSFLRARSIEFTDDWLLVVCR